MSADKIAAEVRAITGHGADVDVLVVGGGINGAGIARDLAGRRLKVMLVEADDLASHTSSSSTKLIHGGLRYLESYEFGLVRKALREREVLMRSAPHIMRPLRFVLPHDDTMRPGWMIRAGLFLYDNLARRELLPASNHIDLRTHVAGAPLKPRFASGFVYSDGWVDDSRLVVLNAVDAAERGATVLTRTRCVSALRGEDHWNVTLRDTGGNLQTVKARAVVNAAGPWAASFLRDAVRFASGEPRPSRQLRLVKGSHIVVRRLFQHDYAYIFQATDSRVLFAIPYEREFTLIGTTDVEVHGEPSNVSATPEEITYLCREVSRYFNAEVVPSDVVWQYAGVRPLLDDDQAEARTISRDYLLDTRSDGPPLLTVWGGKITTFRRLAEEAADSICQMLGEVRASWTASAKLPGGDFGPEATGRPDRDFEAFLQATQRRFPWIAPPVMLRLTRAYGSRIGRVLLNAHAEADLGEEIVPGLFEAELHYLISYEWAQDAHDVLWRRSRIGLHCSEAERERVAQWFSRRASLGASQRVRARTPFESALAGNGGADPPR